MTVSEIRDALNETPFRPLIFTLLTGRSITIPHPEFVDVIDDARAIRLNLPDDSGYQIIDTLLLASVKAA